MVTRIILVSYGRGSRRLRRNEQGDQCNDVTIDRRPESDGVGRIPITPPKCELYGSTPLAARRSETCSCNVIVWGLQSPLPQRERGRRSPPPIIISPRDIAIVSFSTEAASVMVLIISVAIRAPTDRSNARSFLR
jgi:hypothetical protein